MTSNDSRTAPLRLASQFRNELGLFIAIVAVVLVTLLFNQDYLKEPARNAKDILHQTALLGIFALGAAIVIVRSFARIHESNLKKQGVLPLTFADPADYDRVLENDRISVHGLADLAPGKPLSITLHHEDGKTDRAEVRHSLNAEQIEWFRAGSALNVLKREKA